MNMQSSVEKMTAILERQILQAEELLELLLEEQAALSSTDVEKLLSVSFRKEQLLRIVRDLDLGLAKAAKAIAGEDSAEFPRLEELKEFVGKDRFAALSGQKIRLMALRQEILTRTLFNRKFAEEMQLFVQDAMSLIAGARVPPSTYGNGGKKVKAGRGPSLISREV